MRSAVEAFLGSLQSGVSVLEKVAQEESKATLSSGSSLPVACTLERMVTALARSGSTTPSTPMPLGDSSTELVILKVAPRSSGPALSISCRISPQSARGREVRRRTSGDVAQIRRHFPESAETRTSSSKGSPGPEPQLLGYSLRAERRKLSYFNQVPVTEILSTPLARPY